MTALRQQMIDKLVTPITYPNEAITTTALVLRADDKNNCCDIRFVNKEGVMCERENVIVRLTGSGMDWFPVEGDYVTIELSRDICAIVARSVSNYNMDVRSKMELKQDIYSDSFGYPPGGIIY